MTHFLAKVSVWLTLAGLAALGAGALNGYLLRYHHPEEIEATTVVVGDSHSQAAFDPEVIGRSVNLANSAESLIATYYKLRFLEPELVGVEDVVLSLGPHSFMTGVYRSGRDVDPLLSRYTGVVPWHRIEGVGLPLRTVYANRLLEWHRPNDHLISDWKAHRRGDTRQRHGYLGGYLYADPALPRDRSDVSTDVLVEVLDDHYGGDDSGPARMHEAYLDSIVNWTNSRDLRLVLVVTPLTQSYREAVPESASEVLGRVLREMARRRGVIIADWAGADIPEAWFLDHDHVNALGAIEVSRMLQELLEPAP